MSLYKYKVYIKTWGHVSINHTTCKGACHGWDTLVEVHSRCGTSEHNEKVNDWLILITNEEGSHVLSVMHIG